jgi:hypothetical protein
MTPDQVARLRVWGGEAVNWLHVLASDVEEFHNDKRIRQVADILFAILEEIRESEQTPK